MKQILLYSCLCLCSVSVLSRSENGFQDLKARETLLSYFENDAAAAVPKPLTVPITLIPGADSKGAVCLDGTLPGYHLHRGFGSGANSWLVHLEGGGWCNTIRNCVYRKTTRRGSAKFMEKQLPFTGILSNKAEDNPDFYNWNRVKLRYCDGASFSGDSQNEIRDSFKQVSSLMGVGLLFDYSMEDPHNSNFRGLLPLNRLMKHYLGMIEFGAQLYFRGQRIWLTAMQDLMAEGMQNADQALLSGCSAGGLASILHCDEFRDLFPTTTKVKCLSDAGMFLDAVDVSGGRTLRNLFAGVVSVQELQKNLPTTCTSQLDPTSCFFPQNLLANIKTPMFLLNAAYDAWQLDLIAIFGQAGMKSTLIIVQASLAPPSADPRGYWSDCKSDHARCNSSQIQFFQDFRNQMLNAVKGFSKSNENGLFINSCFAHCQSERQDTWYAGDSPRIGNKGIANSVGDWYFDRVAAKAVDCPYPCDSTCHNLVFNDDVISSITISPSTRLTYTLLCLLSASLMSFTFSATWF